jgi:hypothetical protein
MSSNEAKVTIGLDDESKKLLKAAVAAAKTIAAAAAGGKGKGKAAVEEPADDDNDFDADDGEAEDEDGEAEDEDGEAEDEDGEADDDALTIDNVGEALKAYATASGPGGKGSKALAIKILKAKGGTEKLSMLKPAKFEAVIEAAKAATAKLKKKPAAK